MKNKPVLHGCIVGIVGLVVAQLIWAYLPGPAGTVVVLLWAAAVSGYIAGQEAQ